MAEYYQILKAFISSPDDVRDERKIVEEVISRVNISCRESLGIHIDAHDWRQLPPLAHAPENRIQKQLNLLIQECDIFILILYKRYGTVEPGYKKSNTQREIEIALKMLPKNEKFNFLSYFREIPPDVDPGSQEKKVKIQRRNLEKRGVFHGIYKNKSDFERCLTHDLYNTLLKFSVSTPKKDALKHFWQLGIPEGLIQPRLAIIYPAVDRCFMKQERPDRFWFRRLVPHVVFEDFKAIQKVEKTLRMIGFREVDTYNVESVPTDYLKRNRLWLCVPRNRFAQEQLSKYQERTRFRFKEQQIGKETQIFWRKSPEKRHWLNIQSPLAKYLELQRANNPGNEWKTEFGRIFAKDYAILARFTDDVGNVQMVSGMLYDYFIAGIRGLGTWGASWFIDRKYDELNEYIRDERSDVQILLEVSYHDDRILDVRVVSDEPESYFKNENNLKTIKARIRHHG